jgi:2-haloacid dehalogenase
MVPNWTDIEVISFDCYGTLIDWEAGILGALKPVLANHGVTLADRDILECYARFESGLQQGEYLDYRSVLRAVVGAFGRHCGFVPAAAEVGCLEESLPGWRPFSDTVGALQALKPRYRLIVLSNIDDDLFAGTAPHLEIAFDQVITAQQLRSYKPALQNFRQLIRRSGTGPKGILHVAESLYHDIAPARQLGLRSVHVDRGGGRAGSGATLSMAAEPDLVVPDLRSVVGAVFGVGG